MSNDFSSYGLWSLVVLNSVVFIMFIFSFFKPKSARDWRTFGSISAFIIALFTEMYGFPLTIYFLSGWLQKKYPEVDLLSHNSGHLWYTFIGGNGDPHFNILHILSYFVIGAGFYLLSSAWHVLFFSQKMNKLAITGPYSKIRHPQYVAFAMIMFGFLLQWPTVLTLLMFPILLIMYKHLALTEEREVRSIFGKAYDDYANKTPRFIPSWKVRS